MSRRLATLALLALAPLLCAADKPLLVPDVSSRNVEIRTTFTGDELLLFGAIVYPGGRAPARPARQTRARFRTGIGVPHRMCRSRGRAAVRPGSDHAVRRKT